MLLLEPVVSDLRWPSGWAVLASNHIRVGLTPTGGNVGDPSR